MAQEFDRRPEQQDGPQAAPLTIGRPSVGAYVASVSRRDRERRRRRHRAAKLAAGQPVVQSDLPRPLRLVAQSVDELRRYIEAAEDLEQATALALARVEQTARRLAELCSPYDTFDVLENVRLSQSMVDPETYRETEHEGRPAVIEVVAVVLSSRGGRAPAGAWPPGDEPERPVEHGASAVAEGRTRPDPVMDDVIATARELVDAGTMLGLLEAASQPDALSGIGLGALLREIDVRNLAYPHMVKETLSALFDDRRIADDVRALLGCEVADMLAVFEAFIQLHGEALSERFAYLARLDELRRRTTSTPGTFTEQDRLAGRAMWASAWDRLGDCSVLDDLEVAAASGRDPDTVRAVRRAFVAPLTAQHPEDAALAFLRGQGQFRSRPLLADPGGNTVVVHDALLVPAIRERVEEALKTDPAAWARYDKHRAMVLETSALDLVARHLPDAMRYSSVEYLTPGTADQIEPVQYTRLGETDGLLIIDDVAVVVEAKAGALRPRARAGDRTSLERGLRKLVTAAAEQAARVRERILADGGLLLRDGTWLDLSGVREVHAVAVTLDDLSGIATVTSHLVRAGLLSEERLPWTVSLHDLSIISELIDRPAELLKYLRRRSEPDVTRYFHAIDELDFFLEFQATGLYVNPDPDAVAALLPGMPPPRVADRRRRRAQPLNMLTSRTGALDDWYFYRLGIRQRPAPKPSLNANAGLLALVDALAAARRPGWLPMGATLLEGDAATQRRWGRHGGQVSEKTRSDGARHSVTVAGGTRPDDTFVLSWICPPAGRPYPDAQRDAAFYISAKKHQLSAARAMGFIFDAPTGNLMGTVFDNRPPGPDLVLDEAAANLRPPSAMSAPPPRSR